MLRNTLTKLFADLEVKKKKLEDRDQAERSVNTIHKCGQGKILLQLIICRYLVVTLMMCYTCSTVAHYRKRQKEQEEATEEKVKKQKEWKQEWDVSDH